MSYSLDPSFKRLFIHHLETLLGESAIVASPNIHTIIDNSIRDTEQSVTNCLSSWSSITAPVSSLSSLNSRYYAVYLYWLARHLWVQRHQVESNMVSYVNKIVNGCEIYGQVRLPPQFLINHTGGIVLGNVKNYGSRIVINHGVTVGRYLDDSPYIGDSVLLMPHSMVLGRSRIGSGSIISAGTKVINNYVPNDVIVFQGTEGHLIFKDKSKDYSLDWLR